MTGFRRGARLGVDVGTARIGVSRCDPDGFVATPMETVARDASALGRLRALIGEVDPIEIVVGLPINLQGHKTASTRDAEAFAAQLAVATAVPVRLVDERLSTVSAHQALRASGRTSRTSRTIVDQVAAVVLLQQAVDIEKSSGRPPGTLVPPSEESV